METPGLVPSEAGATERSGRGNLFAEEEEVLRKVGNRTYFVVVSYDITDTKRRSRVAKELLAFGERVQYSVFECHLKQRQFDDLVRRVERLIDPAVDRLRVYRIAGSPNLQVWGPIPMTFDEDVLIL